jgi:hypothetical protein
MSVSRCALAALSAIGFALAAQTQTPASASVLTLRCPVINVLDRRDHTGKPVIETLRIDTAKRTIATSEGLEPKGWASVGPWYVVWHEPASGGTATFEYLLDLTTSILMSGVVANGTPQWSGASIGPCSKAYSNAARHLHRAAQASHGYRG